MAKKAFCVGINDYPYPGYDLKGCINDIHEWSELLINHFDFPRSNVKIITDSEATKRNVINGVKDLITKAKAGDVLVFVNASHGSYLLDTSGDEEKFDEIICPYNVKEDEIKDDELRELFIDLPAGVKLTVISDSCFSGTITRVIARVRFLDPSLRGCKVIPDPWRLKKKKIEKYPESAMREILLSGCSDNEFAHEIIYSDVHHGAMSYFALQAIRDANYRITYAELVKWVNDLLEKNGYRQHPQLEGRAENKDRQIFV
jgi:hypothetical protein